jgi:hypothetical protein
MSVATDVTFCFRLLKGALSHAFPHNVSARIELALFRVFFDSLSYWLECYSCSQFQPGCLPPCFSGSRTSLQGTARVYNAQPYQVRGPKHVCSGDLAGRGFRTEYHLGGTSAFDPRSVHATKSPYSDATRHVHHTVLVPPGQARNEIR